MRLRIWRVQIGLAFLKMLNLSRRVLRPYEAAVLASDLIAFGGRVGILELYECTANVRICVSTHRSWCRRCGEALPPWSACLKACSMDDGEDIGDASKRCEGAVAEWISPWVSCLDSRVSYGIAEYMLGYGLVFLLTRFVTKPCPYLFGPRNNTHQNVPASSKASQSRRCTRVASGRCDAVIRTVEP
jgi:hypothetical protein